MPPNRVTFYRDVPPNRVTFLLGIFCLTKGWGHFHFDLYRDAPPNRVTFYRGVPPKRVTFNFESAK